MKMAHSYLVLCIVASTFLTACSSALIVEADTNPANRKAANTIQVQDTVPVINTSTIGRLTGVNWPGFDSDVRVVHALWYNEGGARDYKSMIKQIKDLGFNCIRIPFSTIMVDQLIYPNYNAICINQWVSDKYTGQMGVNLDLQGETSVGIMEKIVAEAGKQNLKIILDDHSHLTNNYWNESLWYYGQYTEARWISNWITIVKRFKKYPNFIGVDLKNEPHGDPAYQPASVCATWGGPPETDWHAAAERCASAIYAEDPNLIIVLQGVQVVDGDSTWWGSNHRGILTKPFLAVPASQILYSVHEYGPEVQDQIWFHDPTFPENMPAIWDKFFYFIEKENIGKIYVGEFGIMQSSVNDPNSIPSKWLTKFLETMGKKVSWTYWAWTGYLADTTGLLSTNDSVSIKMDIYNKIKPYLEPQSGNTSSSTSAYSSARSSAASSTPDGTGTHAVPGTIEAESYNSMSGIQTESCSEGGLNVGWIEANDWMSYNVNIQQTANYLVEYRVSGLYSAGTIDIYQDNVKLTGTSVPNTGGWQTWTTISGSVGLSSGQHTIKLVMNGSGFNLNWIKFTAVAVSSSSSLSSKSSAPASSKVSSSVIASSKSSSSAVVSSAPRSSSVSSAAVSSVPSPIKLQFYNAALTPAVNTLSLRIKLINQSQANINLSSVRIRYYFTADGGQPQSLWIDSAGGYSGGNYINLTQYAVGQVTMVSPKTGVDNIAEFTFTASAPVLSAGGNVELQVRIAKNDWSNYNQSNDYSFNSTATTYVDWLKITGYYNNYLQVGMEP